MCTGPSMQYHKTAALDTCAKLIICVQNYLNGREAVKVCKEISLQPTFSAMKKHFVSLPANIFRICLLCLHLFITHSMRYGLKVRRKVVVIHKICHAGYYINEWW